jgi:hypothetical protein
MVLPNAGATEYPAAARQGPAPAASAKAAPEMIVFLSVIAVSQLCAPRQQRAKRKIAPSPPRRRPVLQSASGLELGAEKPKTGDVA